MVETKGLLAYVIQTPVTDGRSNSRREGSRLLIPRTRGSHGTG